MKTRPLIGITSSQHHGRLMTALNRLAVWRAGGRPVVLRPGEGHARQVHGFEDLDGFVIGGGDDIDVHLYADGPALDTRIDPERDRLELSVLESAARRDRPVLGICRGAQMLNVFLGGTLHVDIHEVYEEAPRLRTVLPRKRVHVAPDSRLARILRTTDVTVNALHHQAVDRLGRGLTVVARDTYGIVQAVEAPDAPLRLGVQWHPEMLFYRGRQRALFQTLVTEARKGAVARVALLSCP